MSGTWGKTGRVTLFGGATEGAHNAETSDLMVDGKKVGWIGAADERSNWWAVVQVVRTGPLNLNLPDRDAAVMWVLRRTAPDVWRAERPVVWRVLRAWERFPVLPWHIHGSDGSDYDAGYCVLEHEGSAANVEYAINVADRKARAEYARAAR